jgi:hypothetical protein
MKFKQHRPYADVDTAMRKLLELANGLEADRAGRLQIGALNSQFKDAGGDYADYGVAMAGRDRQGLPHHAPVRRLCDIHAIRR